LNVERYELTKTGRIAFSHQNGSHDDHFWALAPAVDAAETASTPSRHMARTAQINARPPRAETQAEHVLNSS
jgi:hypothetical protein